MSRLLTGLCFLSLLGLAALQSAQAGVIIGGTRIIYHADKKETSISVKNPGNLSGSHGRQAPVYYYAPAVSPRCGQRKHCPHCAHGRKLTGRPGVSVLGKHQVYSGV